MVTRLLLLPYQISAIVFIPAMGLYGNSMGLCIQNANTPLQLSENSAFARSCTDAGLNFIGPPAEAIEAMGNKSRSKEIMLAAGVPCIPGYHGRNQDVIFLKQQAQEIGYPVLIKAVKGGGGKGMRICRSNEDFDAHLESAKTEARNSFGDDTMLIERYVTSPRHIEVQIMADKHGNCVALGERDCSIQRRHQKIIEESPAPRIDHALRKDLWSKARAAALAVKYVGAGTVEFVVDNDSGEAYFLEMNTRLQVEHPVTEMVTGQDLVLWQILVAEGRTLPQTQADIEQEIASRGWAFEARIYAENPDMNFMPDSGRLVHLRTPRITDTVRVDAGFIAGDEVSSHYDPMIAKLIVRGPTRQAALQKLRAALEDYEVAGPATNIEFLKRLCVSEDFVDGKVETGYIEKHHDDLFTPLPMPQEVWAQAALHTVVAQTSRQHANPLFIPRGTHLGFGDGLQPRLLDFETAAVADAEPTRVSVSLIQTSPDVYDISIDGQNFAGVRTQLMSDDMIESYFAHTRAVTRVVNDDERIHVFHQGRTYKIRQPTPQWLEKALGVKDAAHSVLAPMPCKVLRVHVKEGDMVAKDQPLVVIESMKMETTIRSPVDGTISKVPHSQGDICKAGVALVEFVSEDAN